MGPESCTVECEMDRPWFHFGLIPDRMGTRWNGKGTRTRGKRNAGGWLNGRFTVTRLVLIDVNCVVGREECGEEDGRGEIQD